MIKLKPFAALFAGLFLFAAGPARSAEQASADDTARFLAGMSIPSESPLAKLQDRNWQQHVRSMDQAFGAVDARQLSKIRGWTATHLKSPQPTMYYLFSGPDFLYANAFFPHASTYVMVGLEPPGEVPNLLALQPRYLTGALGAVQASMRTLLQVTFFITNQMSHDLQVSALRGTIPVLYVFLARSGKHLHEASLLSLDDNGAEIPFNAKSPVRGVKITFSGDDKKEQTLYYFSANLANDGLKRSGLLKFMNKLGYGDSLIKSASYLLHGNEFSMARDFLLAKSATLVEDDSGIPLRFFDDKKWELNPFGHYLPPIPVFKYAYQQKMHDLFTKGKPGALEFGFGYHWTKDSSNVLLAVNREAMEALKPKPKEEEKPAAKPAEKSSAAPTDKANEKPLQQPSPAAAEKKPDQAADKPAAAPPDKPAAAAPEKAGATPPAGAPVQAQPAETKTEDRAEKPGEKTVPPAEKQSDKPAPAADKPEEKK